MSNRRMVISAFPATGKTYLAERHPELVDSDSSRFSWKWTSFETRERHPDWPMNYIRHIGHESRTVLVSTHQEVRDALAETRVPFLLVYPRADLRAEYVDRLRRRGDPVGLIEKIDMYWLSMMRSLQEQADCAHVVLGAGEYLRWPL